MNEICIKCKLNLVEKCLNCKLIGMKCYKCMKTCDDCDDKFCDKCLLKIDCLYYCNNCASFCGICRTLYRVWYSDSICEVHRNKCYKCYVLRCAKCKTAIGCKLCNVSNVHVC